MTHRWPLHVCRVNKYLCTSSNGSSGRLRSYNCQSIQAETKRISALHAVEAKNYGRHPLTKEWTIYYLVAKIQLKICLRSTYLLLSAIQCAAKNHHESTL